MSADTRMRCLELAAQQIGPWKKGPSERHQVTLLSLALMYGVYCDEGYDAACEIARNDVRPDMAELIKLVKGFGV